MVKRIGTSRRKTRDLFMVPKKMKGKLNVSGFVKKLEMGENVVLMGHPSITKGLYFRRFHGRIGLIVGKQGSSYMVRLKDGGKEKTLLVGPVHLRKA